jgi:hypothetical protein
MNEHLLLSLISLGVGALLGGAVQAVVSRYAAFKESNGMALALRAEIMAIIRLVEYRQYLTHLSRIIQTLQNVDHQPTHRDVFSVNINQDYFETFHSLCSKIGMLGSLSTSVVKFYTQAKGVLEDLRRLYEIHERAQRGEVTVNRADLLTYTQHLHALMQNTMHTGDQVAHELEAYSMRGFAQSRRQ